MDTTNEKIEGICEAIVGITVISTGIFFLLTFGFCMFFNVDPTRYPLNSFPFWKQLTTLILSGLMGLSIIICFVASVVQSIFLDKNLQTRK
jgi:hypothetical protein